MAIRKHSTMHHTKTALHHAQASKHQIHAAHAAHHAAGGHHSGASHHAVAHHSGHPRIHSDVNVKTNIRPVAQGAAAILERVAQLPVSTWSYLDESPEIRHIGPTAQDFRDAFGLGAGDTEIYIVDALGVLFAAVQALAAQVRALEANGAG